jgi:glutamine amidotransferase
MDVYVYDNGISNLKSMVSAIEYTGNNPIITSDCRISRKSNHIILPGVGSFDAAMRQMQKSSADLRIQDFVSSGGHVLGVCLGMQLLFEQGLEGDQVSGLGILKGTVEHLPAPSKADGDTSPNMGWHDVKIRTNTVLVEKDVNITQCYFVHSYHCIPTDLSTITMQINYGNQDICAGVNSGEVHGVQFHPEKSGEMGLDMIKRFINS